MILFSLFSTNLSKELLQPEITTYALLLMLNACKLYRTTVHMILLSSYNVYFSCWTNSMPYFWICNCLIFCSECVSIGNKQDQASIICVCEVSRYNFCSQHANEWCVYTKSIVRPEISVYQTHWIVCTHRVCITSLIRIRIYQATSHWPPEMYSREGLVGQWNPHITQWSYMVMLKLIKFLNFCHLFQNLLQL